MSSREVHSVDAIEWLQSSPILEGCSFVASLPDVSEFPNYSLEEWKKWFTDTATLILSRCPDDGVVVFYQTDIKVDGVWIDKAYLVQKAAEATGHAQLWHKIMCRVQPGIITFGRPAYSHMLCFSKGVRPNAGHSTADVVPDLGEKTWVRGMGLEACLIIGKFISQETTSKTLIHPFCGEGSMLAAANALGLNAVGLEKSRKRAQKARELQVILDGKGARYL